MLAEFYYTVHTETPTSIEGTSNSPKCKTNIFSVRAFPMPSSVLTNNEKVAGTAHTPYIDTTEALRPLGRYCATRVHNIWQQIYLSKIVYFIFLIQTTRYIHAT
jgi:hypothetical protein